MAMVPDGETSLWRYWAATLVSLVVFTLVAAFMLYASNFVAKFRALLKDWKAKTKSKPRPQKSEKQSSRASSKEELPKFDV